jgi:hypothetical protein
MAVLGVNITEISTTELHGVFHGVTRSSYISLLNLECRSRAVLISTFNCSSFVGSFTLGFFAPCPLKGVQESQPRGRNPLNGRLFPPVGGIKGGFNPLMKN